MPDWFYAREIKQILAHGALRDRPQHARLVLPPRYAAWAAGQAEILLEGLRDAKYHIVGDLADLRPAGQAGPHASAARQPAAGPAELPAAGPAERSRRARQPPGRLSSNSKRPCRPPWLWPTATTRRCTRSGSQSRTAPRGREPATSSGRC